MNISVKTRPWEKVLGWILLVLHVLVLPVLIEIACYLLNIPITTGELNIIFFVTAFLLTLGFFGRFLWENLKNFKRELKNSLYAVLGGFGIYYVLNIAVNILIMNLMPEYSNVNNDNIASLTDVYYLPMFLCTVLLVPVTEEVLYRGMLFGLPWQKNRYLAYFVSTLVFSLIHMVGYIGQAPISYLLIGLFQYVPATIGMGYAYEKADSICAPMLIHMFVNLLGMIAMRFV